MEREARLRVVGLAALVFLILCSYAVARPAVESIFLTEHGVDSIPVVWLAVAVGSVVVVGFYNRFSADRDLVFLFGAVSGISALILIVLLGAWELGMPKTAFLLYVWKDIYIVLLVEIFWSFANSVFPKETARKTYGLFCVVGSVGGITGNLLVGYLAAVYGTERSLLAVLPMLAFAWVGCRWLGTTAPSGGSGARQPRSSLLSGFEVLKSSRYLVWMLLLIAVTQVVINLVDFRYNALLELAYPDTDARTAVIGRVYALIDLCGIGLQLCTGLILGLLGVAGALFLVPWLLCGTLLANALLPGFTFMAVTKVASKALDYSIFRAAKEMLYLPLSHREKTQGKALVDVMTYRVTKGAVSLLLLVFVAIDARGLALAASFIGIGAWLLLVRTLVRHYRVLDVDRSMTQWD